MTASPHFFPVQWLPLLTPPLHSDCSHPISSVIASPHPIPAQWLPLLTPSLHDDYPLPPHPCSDCLSSLHPCTVTLFSLQPWTVTASFYPIPAQWLPLLTLSLHSHCLYLPLAPGSHGLFLASSPGSHCHWTSKLPSDWEGLSFSDLWYRQNHSVWTGHLGPLWRCFDIHLYFCTTIHNF